MDLDDTWVDDDFETDERPTVRIPLRVPTDRLLEEVIERHQRQIVTIRESKRRTKPKY